jgi:hypothetical protein
MIVGDAMTISLGLTPQAVFEQFALWQPLTYMFLHSTGGVGHILFNMLALWMIGTDLERTWGTRFFVKYYFVTGIGAGAASLLLSIFSETIYYSPMVGASGAIYGLLLALRDVLPEPDVDPVHLPGAGAHRRDDPRRDRVCLIDGGPAAASPTRRTSAG